MAHVGDVLPHRPSIESLLRQHAEQIAQLQGALAVDLAQGPPEGDPLVYDEVRACGGGGGAMPVMVVSSSASGIGFTHEQLHASRMVTKLVRPVSLSGARS